MEFMNLEQVRTVIANNADRIRDALQAKYGSLEDMERNYDRRHNVDMDFTFVGDGDTMYHCIVNLTADETKLVRAYAVNGDSGVDLNVKNPEVEEYDNVMADWADEVDMLCVDPDAFPVIDLGPHGAEQGAWDPMADQ